MALADSAHFDRLFDRYWESVFRFCYVRLDDWHLAEDAASQTFLNALRALPTFRAADAQNSFRAWLFAIARNEVAGMHRRRLRQPVVALDSVPEQDDAAVSLEDRAIASERHDRLQQTLASFPADQRDLIELRLAGLTSAEIGTVLGKSEAAVRKAQSRIVQTLRRELNQIGHRTRGTVMNGKFDRTLNQFWDNFVERRPLPSELDPQSARAIAELHSLNTAPLPGLGSRASPAAHLCFRNSITGVRHVYTRSATTVGQRSFRALATGTVSVVPSVSKPPILSRRALLSLAAAILIAFASFGGYLAEQRYFGGDPAPAAGCHPGSAGHA